MKKRLLLLPLLAILLVLTACGQGGGAAGVFSGEDLVLHMGEHQYRLGENMEAVLADLGEDYQYSEAKSCDYDGLDKHYAYGKTEFYTWPMEGGDLVNEIFSTDRAVTTSKGIAVGAAKEEVLAAYGTECEDTGYQLIYRVDGDSLCFDLENGAVTAVYITSRPL